MRSLISALLMLLLPCVPARADMAEDSELHADIDVKVALDPAAQSGRASAVVRIHALREIVWPLVTSCAEAVKLVPGLIDCEVLQTSPDRTTQVIRQMIEYSWYVPKLTYELRASYEYPERVSIERISGDLAALRGSWYLESDGDSTIAHYSVDLQPGFWVPRWLVRAALRHDLPKLLRAVRTRAEAVQQGSP